MASLVEEVADYLEDESIGTVGTDIFVCTLPDEQDSENDIVALYDTGGIAPYDHMPLKRRTIQIIVRDTDYPSAEAKARNIRDLLHNRFWQDVVTAGDNFQLRSEALQEPGSIGPDEKNRYLISCNYLFLTR